MAHIRQPRPDSGLGFPAKDVETFEVAPSSFGTGWTKVSAVQSRVVWGTHYGGPINQNRGRPLKEVDLEFDLREVVYLGDI